MSAIVRSRLISLISKNQKLFYLNSAKEPPPIISSASYSSSASITPPPPPPPQPSVSPVPPPPQPPASLSSSSPVIDPPPISDAAPTQNVTPKNKSWRFLKYTLIAALTGATATAGYASYAYSLDEVDKKTRALRESAKYTIEDDASTLDKFEALLYSSAMTVPAKATELYIDLRRLIEEHVRDFTEPLSDKLLPDLHPLEQHIFTLVLDLNETLIYSDWKRDRGWRTFKRPGVEYFLEHMAQLYEIVVYSDQLSMYVDPVVERLDQKQCIRYRLSRAATRYQKGKHYRDLSKLNRDPARVLYVSGHALDSCLQPENGVQIKPWKLEDDDTQLVDLIPFLEFVARSRPADIRPVLESYKGRDIAQEFIERSKDYKRRLVEQKQHSRFWQR